MSIIVAVHVADTTVMASDSITCYGDERIIPAPNSLTAKMRRLGASLVGASGWAVYDLIISDFLKDHPVPDLGDELKIFSFFMEFWKALHDRYSFVNDQAQSKDSPFGDLDSSFLIANAGGIFKVSTDMDVSRFAQYYVIGSGAEYALGSLHSLYGTGLDAETLARRAVAAACHFDTHCGGDTVVLEVAQEA